ncbi:MAG: GNAT family N-acetyltransferase [Thermoanaerobaculia bacterium]
MASSASTLASLAVYPRDEERDVVLRDGSTVRLRPIRPDDAPRLLELYHHLSNESLYFRFFVVPQEDAVRAEYLANVDYDLLFALVGELGDRVVGVARYERDPVNPARAEAAFVVADELQGRGLGTRLLERLAEAGRARGLSQFTAEVLLENRRMIDFFTSSGFTTTRKLEEGALHFELSLTPSVQLEEKEAHRASLAAAASMKKFFEPKVVAVIGASRRKGQIGGEVLRNLKETGFTGLLYAINPNASEIEGVPCFPRLADVPCPVDLAIVVVPAAEVPAVVDDCLAKGVRALILITAGFSETGEAGRAAEAALLEKVRAAGARMIGPNCMGILNTDPAVNLNATFAPVYPPPGRVAMSSQSGALGLAIIDQAKQLNIGFSTFVSVGNKADVSGNDLIQYWSEDPRTDVILLYLESFGNPRKFGQLARRISRVKPIAAVKAGRSKAGARAASSHTGALASSDAVVDALFRHSGVLRTNTLSELFDVANLLAHQPVPNGRRVAIVTNAGGPGILASDACEAAGLELPALSVETTAALRALLPPAASVGNPVDMIASANAEQYQRAMELLLADPSVDSLIVIYIPPLVTHAEAVARGIVEGARSANGKTVLATFMSAAGAPDALSKIPCYPFPESAAIALGRVARYGEWRKKPVGRIPVAPDLDVAAIRVIVDGALARGGGWLSVAETQSFLGACRVAAPEARIVKSATEAARAARELGMPVVLKASGASILHKSDVGGVKLGLKTAAAVRRAYSDFAARLGDQLEGAIVQKMVEGGAEMVVGAVVDPVFGPVVAYGSGGVLVELLGDVSFRIQPLTDVDVTEMLDEVKGTALLRGFRGAPRLDEEALSALLHRVSALLAAAPEIQEMDFNPVKVLASGVQVLDARIRVAVLPEAAPSRQISY